jgi:outer membrane protein
MKKVNALLAAAALLLASGRVAAQSNSTPKIAVMDVLRAIVECQEGKLANEDFQKKYEAKKEELTKKQKELEELQQQLKTQASTLNGQARAALTRNIEIRSTELQRGQEDAEKEFNALRNEIFSRIGSKLAPVVRQHAKDNNFSVVFDSSNQSNQLSYVDPALDITDDVIKRFDAAQASSSGTPAAPKPAVTPATKPPATPASPPGPAPRKN